MTTPTPTNPTHLSARLSFVGAGTIAIDTRTRTRTDALTIDAAVALAIASRPPA